MAEDPTMAMDQTMILEINVVDMTKVAMAGKKVIRFVSFYTFINR